MAFTCPPPPDFLETALHLERRMRRVVVTGVAGCGKSLFMRMLGEEGVSTWSADAAVVRLYEPGQEAWLALRRRYGDRFVPDDHTPVTARRWLRRCCLPPRMALTSANWKAFCIL
ncbi:MAG: dephospho-CoA kinase [Bilophila sp.]